MNITEMRKPEKRMQKIILNILLHMQSSELVKVQVRKGFRWETRLQSSCYVLLSHSMILSKVLTWQILLTIEHFKI